MLYPNIALRTGVVTASSQPNCSAIYPLTLAQEHQTQRKGSHCTFFFVPLRIVQRQEKRTEHQTAQRIRVMWLNEGAMLLHV
jgi:hypothetical protein